MRPLVAAVGLALVRSACPATDSVKAVALSIFPEIMMIPEKSRPRGHSDLKITVLEDVDISEAVEVMLTDSYSRLLQQLLHQRKHRNSVPAFKSVF